MAGHAVVAARPAAARTLPASSAAQLFAAAGFDPASDALTLTLFAWAEAAEAGPLDGSIPIAWTPPHRDRCVERCQPLDLLKPVGVEA